MITNCNLALTTVRYAHASLMSSFYQSLSKICLIFFTSHKHHAPFLISHFQLAGTSYQHLIMLSFKLKNSRNKSTINLSLLPVSPIKPSPFLSSYLHSQASPKGRPWPFILEMENNKRRKPPRNVRKNLLQKNSNMFILRCL